MNLDETFRMSSDEVLRGTEAFLIERFQSYTEPDGKGGMRWVEPIRLRLREIDDYKRQIREAIFRNKTRFGSDFSCGEDAEEKRISETIEEFCDTLIQELNL